MSCGNDEYLLKDTLNLKEKYNIDTLVESGCYYGWTLREIHDKFQKIYSCDINQNFINDAWDYIKKDDVNAGSNIEISYMDGASHLEHLYKNKKIDNKNFILFSDGHEKGQTSELDELEVMIEYGLKPIIIYHDFKNPNHNEFSYDVFDVGDNDIELVKPKLDECFGKNNYELQYNDNSSQNVGYLIIIPNIYNLNKGE